jgi:aryl-alcohol dehydrogenase-like predicted oxidoreductase
VCNLPAWVVAEGQVIAGFRGWAPVTALGVSILPWSPLHGRQLSGKYVRDGGPPADSRRAGAARY